ncbi:MAG: restriction endonuclease subunit S [Candidatus Nanopusillus acidilobi]
MAVFSIIKLSELEGAKRIDAEYYKPEYLSLLDRLRKAGCVPAKSVAFPVRRKFKPNVGEYFDYIEISEVDLSTGEFNISKIIGEEAPDRAQWIVAKEDVLVSTVRPIRNAVVLIREDKENLVCSSGFAVIHPYKIQANYLFLYFKTSFVPKLLDRYTTATEYPAINWNDVLNTPIYVGSEEFQVKVSFLINECFALLEQSRALYSQAENLLLEELGFGNFKPKYKKTYTAKLSDAFSTHRIDAEYFQPAYEEVIENIKNYRYGFDKLLKHVENVEPNFDPTKYPEESFCYVELADIDSSIGVIQNTNDIKGQEAPSRARRILKKNDVIVSSVEGSLEKVALVDKEHDGCLASTGFFQFRPLKIPPEVFLILLKTPVLQSQLKKKCSGTILTAIPKKSLGDIVIPLLPYPTQQEIASLIQKSHEARKKAKELLNAAKKAVEIAIEEGENDALNYLSKIKIS